MSDLEQLAMRDADKVKVIEHVCVDALEVLKLDVSLKYEGIRKKKMARWVDRIKKGVKAGAR